MADLQNARSNAHSFHPSPEVQAALAHVVIGLEQALRANLQEIMLYGSQARGDARSDSDIGLLVVVGTGNDAAEEAARRATYDVMASRGSDVLISALVIDEAAYRAMQAEGYSFARNLNRERVVLWSRAA
jgi:predicted nucleotidyltransferase